MESQEKLQKKDYVLALVLVALLVAWAVWEISIA